MSELTRADLEQLEKRLVEAVRDMRTALTDRLDTLNGSVAKNAARSTANETKITLLEVYNRSQEELKRAVTEAVRGERQQRKDDLGVGEKPGGLESAKMLAQQWNGAAAIIVMLLYILAKVLGVDLP